MNRKLIIAALAASALLAGGAVAVAEDSGDGRGTTASAGTSTLRTGDDDARELPSAGITAREAIDKALAAVPGGTVGSVEWDDEDGGGRAWEVDVAGKDGEWHEVSVDASHGKILADRAGQNDDAADEAGDDRDHDGERGEGTRDRDDSDSDSDDGDGD